MPDISQFFAKQQIIFIDTAIFIYHFENSEKYSPITKVLFNALDENFICAITSVITLIIKSIDALQIGTAIVMGAKLFITNDLQLEQVTEIEVVVLSKIK